MIINTLDTMPNTTSKQFRTHTWGYASFPPSWLYTAYTAAVVPLALGIFSIHSIPSRLNSTTATIWAESTKSLRRPQHPSTGHPIAFQLGLGFGFGSSGHNHVFFVFPTAAVEMSILVQQYSKTVMHMLLNIEDFS